MDVLYVKRRINDPFWKKSLKWLRQYWTFWGREGFFRASLHHEHSVTEIGAGGLTRSSTGWINSFDRIIFNFRCNFSGGDSAYDSLEDLLEREGPRIAAPRVLLVTSASAGDLPGNKVASYFDLIFRRERFRDLDAYHQLKPEHRQKVRTTMLSCPLVTANRLNYRWIDASSHGYSSPPENPDHDVFFLGTATSRQRVDIVDALEQSSVTFSGGLQEKSSLDYEIPDRLLCSRLSRREYVQEIRNSKINLALEGYGEFTYRHLELWCLGVFMISSPSLNELHLPLDVEEGIHYVTFDSTEDLIQKVHYYRENPQERRGIARNGRRAFEEGYDFERHGTYLENHLSSISDSAG